MRSIRKGKLIKETAEKLGVNEKDVEQIITAYYKELRKKLTSLDYINIGVPGLGVFSILKYKLEKKIKKQEDIFRNLEKNERKTMLRFGIKKGIEENIVKYKKAFVALEEEELRKIEHKKLREEYEKNN